MSFSRRRAPGLFIDGSVVTGAEFEYWDAAIGSAFDPVGGGAYSLEANVAIGGAPGVYWQFDLGVTFSDNVGVQGVFETYGNVAMYEDVSIGSGPGDVLNVQSPATFYGTLNVLGYSELGDTTITGEFTAAGDAFFNHPADFASDVHFHGGTVTMGASGADAFTVNAFTTFNDTGIHNGPEYFYQDVTVGAGLTFTGVGKVLYRQKTVSVAGNQSVVAANYDTVYIPAGVMADLQTIVIDDTGARDGMRVRFLTNDPTNTIGACTPGFGLTAPLKYANGSQQNVEFERISGVWRRSGSGDL